MVFASLNGPKGATLVLKSLPATGKFLQSEIAKRFTQASAGLLGNKTDEQTRLKDELRRREVEKQQDAFDTSKKKTPASK
jgi:hypothetical protein